MKLLWILAGVAALLGALAVGAAYICYRMAFYSPDRKAHPLDYIDLPEGEVYEPHHEQMTRWVREIRAMKREDVQIKSFDGLTLRGYYYEYAPGAPIELMFHGYRGNSERDLCGGVQRCFSLGRSALLVDQRGSGRSEGNVISFGINEHRDCLSWLEFMGKRFGSDVKIILTGISMGAATVCMAAGTQLPENVIGVLADCGFTSARDIMKIVIRKMGLPENLSFPFVKLGARLFGKFDLEETSAVRALERAQVPVIFFHGAADDFVPPEMSRVNYERCASRKKLVIIPGAGHGLSFPAAPETYLAELRDFFGPEASARYSESLCRGGS